MKTRTTFVSNSSSSSFIIKTKLNDKGEALLTINLSNFLDGVDSNGTVSAIKNIEELNVFFKDRYEDYEGDKWNELEFYKNSVKELESGGMLAVGRIDQSLGSLIGCACGDSKVINHEG